MKKTMALLAGAALMVLTTSAWAIPITGTISFTGSEFLTPSTATIANAIGIHFSNDAQVQGIGSGTYAAILGGTPATFTDFSFKPFEHGINSLWVLTYLDKTYSFDLSSLTTELQSNSFLVLKGEGILNATGFDPTPGNWFFSTQGQGATFSAESNPAPVPEPSTLVLLGAAFFGLAIYRKRRSNQDGSCHA